MKKCKSCQTEIDDKAKKCPKCQADQRNWFVRHKITSAVLVLIILGVVGAAAGSGKSTNQNSQSASSSTQPQQVMQITAAQIADDYDNNQVAANNKWKGKLVQFSATVSNITSSGVSFYNVASKEGSLTQISCEDSNSQDLSGLANGQSATVKGTVDGQTIGVISLKNCSVVK